jgi:hypothetical protein
MHDSKVELLYDTRDELENLLNLSRIELLKARNRISANIDCVIHDLAEEQIDEGLEDPRR